MEFWITRFTDGKNFPEFKLSKKSTHFANSKISPRIKARTDEPHIKAVSKIKPSNKKKDAKENEKPETNENTILPKEKVNVSILQKLLSDEFKEHQQVEKNWAFQENRKTGNICQLQKSSKAGMNKITLNYTKKKENWEMKTGFKIQESLKIRDIGNFKMPENYRIQENNAVQIYAKKRIPKKALIKGKIQEYENVWNEILEIYNKLKEQNTWQHQFSENDEQSEKKGEKKNTTNLLDPIDDEILNWYLMREQLSTMKTQEQAESATSRNKLSSTVSEKGNSSVKVRQELYSDKNPINCLNQQKFMQANQPNYKIFTYSQEQQQWIGINVHNTHLQLWCDRHGVINSVKRSKSQNFVHNESTQISSQSPADFHDLYAENHLHCIGIKKFENTQRNVQRSWKGSLESQGFLHYQPQHNQQRILQQYQYQQQQVFQQKQFIQQREWPQCQQQRQQQSQQRRQQQRQQHQKQHEFIERNLLQKELLYQEYPMGVYDYLPNMHLEKARNEQFANALLDRTHHSTTEQFLIDNENVIEQKLDLQRQTYPYMHDNRHQQPYYGEPADIDA